MGTKPPENAHGGMSASPRVMVNQACTGYFGYPF